MASLALGTLYVFFPGDRSINTACRLLQGTGPLPLRLRSGQTSPGGLAPRSTQCMVCLEPWI